MKIWVSWSFDTASLMYSSVFSSIRFMRSFSFFPVKLRSLPFTALNLPPSIATSSRPYRPCSTHSSTNARKTFFSALPLSRRKRDIVLWSGDSLPSSQITSRFLFVSVSSLRDERTRFR